MNPKPLDLAAIQPGDELIVRVKVASTLPGDIPLFNIGGVHGESIIGQRPHWITADAVVAHYPAKP